MELLPEYQKYVFARVLKEPHGYTILRAGLELAEEYLEFSLADSYSEYVEELGDLYFWFAYFCQITGYEETLVSHPDMELSEIILKIVGCVKRFYRDSNTDKLPEIRDKWLPGLHYWLNIYANRAKPTIFLDYLAIFNVSKLDERFGSSIPESEPFINKESS